MPGRPRLLELVLAENPEPWMELGFTLDADGCCRIGPTALRFTGGEGGIAAWTLAGSTAMLDGLATTVAEGAPPDPPPAPRHANGVSAIDHVVVSTPDPRRTFAAFETAGFELRGTREAGELVQGFLLTREALVEVAGPRAQPSGDGPAAFWGLTLVTDDLDAAAALLGQRLGRVKDAVQPGRRIATVRTGEAGVGTRLALITPRS